MRPDAMIDLHERLAVMRQQETTTYRCEDYLSHASQQQQEAASKKATNTSCYPPTSGDGSSSSCSGVSEEWREKICEWSYQVVDHFDFNREIVSISLSYLDRFLSTRTVNKKIFQLAAMTTLYLAIKLNEQRRLKMSSLIELSRGYFMVEHIAAMEEAILRALSWHVHPPTSLAFIRHLLLMLPQDACSPAVKHELSELSRFLTELGVCDYFFVTRKPSALALAAVMNAMEGIDESRLSRDARLSFVEKVRCVAMIDSNDDEVEECQARLREMYYQGGYYQHHQESVKEHSMGTDDQRIESGSPVCVAGMPEQAADHPQHQHYTYYQH